MVLIDDSIDFGNMIGVGLARGHWRKGLRMTHYAARKKDPERMAAIIDRQFIDWIKRPKEGRGRPGWKKRRRA